MKKVICPIDFSDLSLAALHYAVEITDLLGGHLVIVHSIHLPSLEGRVPMSEVMLEKTKKEAENKLIEITEHTTTKFKRRGSFASVEYQLFEGLLVDVLVRINKNENPDMFVMGTLGASGLGDYLLGSNTSRVVKKVDCPVLLVPFDNTYNRINKIVFGTALSEDEIPALEYLIGYAEKTNAAIKVVHVGNPNSKIVANRFEEHKQMINKKLKNNQLVFDLEYHKDEFEGLNKYLKRNKADVLAIHNRRRNFVSKLFDDSVTDDLVFHSDLPVLCINLR